VVRALDLAAATGGDQPIASRKLVPVYLTHAVVHLLVGLFPAVLFMLRTQFATSYATLGAAFTAATLVYGFGSIPVGMVLNRVSPLTLVRISLVAASLSAFAIAAAPNEVTFCIALVLLGASCAPYHACGLTLVSRVSGNDPHMLAHHGMVGNIGLAAAPTFGALLAWLVSWRLPFACAGALGLALAAVLWLRMPPLSEPAQVSQSGDRRPRDRTYVPALALVFAITIALGFIYRGFATYLPSWMAQRADVLSAPQVVRGGLIASLVYAVGFFGQWFGGHAGSRARPERLYALLLAATAGLLAASFFASGWPLVLILAAFSFVHFSTQPMDNIFTGKYTSLDRRGLGYGVSFALSFGFGSFAAWSGGAVVDAAGGQLRYISLLLCGAAVLATVCGVALAALADRLRR